ncbi:MAG TPA: cytochrome c [Gemmatimonadales bacterium]|nr:cytochrome c [Gemmatimonadales bacterium]
MPERSRNALAAVLVFVALAVGLGVGLIGFAIGRGTGEEAAPTTVTVGAETQPAGEETRRARTGKELYLAAGCGSCHGQNAEGTDVGPSLGGHTAEQVHQQVRSPLAQMPAYRVNQLSDGDLDKIAQYIAGLEAMEEHVEPVKLSEVVAVHHWMAISAIASGDREDALHHVGHIIEAVKGEHLETMKEARSLLRAGELHEAEHLIEEMLAGKAKPELSRERLSLRLALAAVEQRDRGEAIHQIRHYLALSQGRNRQKGQAVLMHLRNGELHEAEHVIADLLGIERD